MINSKNNTTKRRIEVNNYQVTFDVIHILELVNSINSDVINILELINSIDSRVARIERQIKEIKRTGGNRNG